jgi:hypothetical protein
MRGQARGWLCLSQAYSAEFDFGPHLASTRISTWARASGVSLSNAGPALDPSTAAALWSATVCKRAAGGSARRLWLREAAVIAFSPQGWLWRSKPKRWHQREPGWRQFAVISIREQPYQQAAAAAVSAAAWRTASTHLDGVSMGSQPGGCLASLALQPPPVESHHISHKGAMRSLQDRRVQQPLPAARRCTGRKDKQGFFRRSDGQQPAA